MTIVLAADADAIAERRRTPAERQPLEQTIGEVRFRKDCREGRWGKFLFTSPIR
jgi:hypothetical protein